MRARLGSQDGFVLASSMMIMLIVLLFTVSVTKVVVASLNEDQRDRSSAQAFQLADSAVDEVVWHMNRQLVSDEVKSLASAGAGTAVPSGTVATNACLTLTGSVYALNVLTADTTSHFCPSISLPNLAGGESVTCYVGLQFNVSLVPLSLLQRTVVCQGNVGGAKRRIKATMSLSVSGGNPTKLWRRASWVECTADFTSTLNPAAGCPT